ncbi:MAG: hypothetical protein JSW71_12875 [Gemmatimonadota bacterium]|nr:MAG: hypothetical protein JSW71_12875 [Gemmatimonadota bacterium]
MKKRVRALGPLVITVSSTVVLCGSTLLAWGEAHDLVTARAERETTDATLLGIYNPGRAGFALRTASVASSFRIQTVSVTPGSSIALRVSNAPSRARFDLIVDAGTLSRPKDRSWTWRAPDKSALYRVWVIRTDVPDTIVVNAFVTVPTDRLDGEYLNGYRIGRYPKPPRPIYRHPEGFIEVTPQNLDVWVSPHFQLRQFVCKQRSGYPKYVVLEPTILNKLEIILERFNAAGYHANSFKVLSGYRTPHYNQAIGNVALSRHVWGAAADIFVDEDGEDYMDDINGDGRRDISDIRVLYDIANELATEADYQVFVGGLGTYGANSRHGPYLHVDVRGRRVRWWR